eukprot:7570498-Ditylum_brightwellii.AAC.1
MACHHVQQNAHQQLTLHGGYPGQSNAPPVYPLPHSHAVAHMLSLCLNKAGGHPSLPQQPPQQTVQPLREPTITPVQPHAIT